VRLAHEAARRFGRRLRRLQNSLVSANPAEQAPGRTRDVGSTGSGVATACRGGAGFSLSIESANSARMMSWRMASLSGCSTTCAASTEGGASAASAMASM
jgi:hypothetical protein